MATIEISTSQRALERRSVVRLALTFALTIPLALKQNRLSSLTTEIGGRSMLNTVSATIRRALSFPGAIVLTIGALFAASTTLAQEFEDENALNDEVEEITVTGSRIERSGYDAPTPVTVLGAEGLDAMAVPNVAIAVNRLPMLSGSVTSRNLTTDVSDGLSGVNQLNLRGLGVSRTLVLLDGKRMVGSTVNNSAIDVNSLPNALVERVEVVTGGASAAYGSDALSGVVNFILNTDYTGFKGDVQGGSTTHGDGGNFKASFTGGMPFAEGRGHFVFSGEHALEGGITGNPRDWTDAGYQLITNPNYSPTNGQPQLITVFNGGLSVATPGGLIVSCPSAPGTQCPLRGTMFLDGGTPVEFEFGPIISGVVMSGGDWQLSRIDNQPNLAIELERNTAYTRASYDVSDSTTAYAVVHWSRSDTYNRSIPYFSLGNITILSDNPHIPASVQAEMTALGIPSFTLGTTNIDMPHLQIANRRTLERYVAGIKGAFGAVGTDWEWDAYYSRSTNDIISTMPDNRIEANHTRAIDAVLDNGQIVCRVNVDADPANDDSACVPYNPMGIGVNSAAAIDYVTGTGRIETLLEQDVIAVSAAGEPFSNWAGPVSLAFGAEHRREAASGSSTPLDMAGAFFAGNYRPTQGKYDVTEGFLETIVPLANGQRFAESLDVSGAMRWTDYSTSGEVMTWKLGVTWALSEDMRFRLTRSRDIRAPNMGELFNAGEGGRSTIFDPVTNAPADFIVQTRGNPELVPEEADTTGIGVVFTPAFLPGFGASIDYYDIDIEGAMVVLGAQELVNRCFAGETTLCSSIERDANGVIQLLIDRPQNVLSQATSGIDFELSYTLPLSIIRSNWEGEVALRGLWTYLDSLETIDARGKIEGAGVNADSMGIGAGTALFAPELRYLFSATYDNYPLFATLFMRGIGSGVYNNAFIECSSDCPPATEAHPTINNNHIDAVTYFDLALRYAGLFDERAEVFIAVSNVLDEAPPLIAGTSNNGFYRGPGNVTFYDRLGRTLRAGIRFEF